MAREQHGTGRQAGRITAGFALALALAGIGVLAPSAESSQHAASAAPVAPAPTPPAWGMIQQAAPRLALDAPELAKLPASAGLFRNGAGMTDDRLIWGSLKATGAPFVRLAVRHGHAAPASLFVAMARLAASDGLAVLHLAAPASFTAKFGAFSSATARLADDGAGRACLVFRHDDAQAGFEIAGWYCGAEGNPPDSRTLACLIDRLSLAEPVDDPGLSRIFAAAAQRPATCPASSPETVTGGITAPSTAAVQNADRQKTKSRQAKAHKPKAHQSRAHKARHPQR